MVPTRTRASWLGLAGGSLRAVVLVACIASACGGGTTEPQANESSAGQSSDDCQNGETRECVGPGACTGGQFCSDGAWERCECAANGDAGEGGTPPAQEMGASGATSSGGSTNTSAVAGATSPFSSPCYVIDECGVGYDDILEITEDENHVVFRTPKASMYPAECISCPKIASRLELRVRSAETDERPSGHFTVRPPWQFGSCDEPSQCTEEAAIVWTESNDAPEVNVYYEPGPCPTIP
jgi:hypothetical protein